MQEKIEREYGTNMLIQKGAPLVIEPNEIIQKYTNKKVKQLSIEDLECNKKIKQVDLKEIKEEYRKIYKVLTKELNINEINIKTGIEISELYEKLLLMQMEGIIENDKGKYKALIKLKKGLI